jgi:hypothetical protein
MAIVTKVIQPGNRQQSTLSGYVRMEEANNRIVIDDGSGNKIVMGTLPNGLGFGVGYFDSNGALIRKDTGDQINFYDPSTGKNYLRAGRLPDNTYGWDVAAEGYNVEDVYGV